MRKRLALLIAIALFACTLAGCYSDWSPSRGPAARIPASTQPAEENWPPLGRAVAAPGAAAPSLPAEPELRDYLLMAGLNNPGLAAAYEDWQADLEKIPQVRALPDPRVSYSYYIQEVETRVGPQRNSVQLTQMLPWIGKLALRGDAAAQAAEASRLRYEAKKLDLFYQVKDAYYDYYYLGQAVAVTDENLRLLKNVQDVARTRYKTSEAGRGDLIRLEVEAGKLGDRLRQLRDMKGPAQAKLLAAMGMNRRPDLPWPTKVESARLADANDEPIVKLAQQSSPALAALDAEAAERQKQILLAQKEYFPDVTVGLTWIDTGPAWHMNPSDSGKDPLIAMVSVNLPIWWDKLDAGVREARQRHLAALSRRMAQENDLVSRIRMAAFQYRDAAGKLDLYERVLIPRATEALRLTETGYASGTASFADLLDAQRVLLEFQLTSRQAKADRARRLAMLEMLVGRKLDVKE